MEVKGTDKEQVFAVTEAYTMPRRKKDNPSATDLQIFQNQE